MCSAFMAKKVRGRLPGDLRDIGLELFGFISPGERPAHVAGSVPHIGPNAARAPLFLVGQGFDNEWHNCKTQQKCMSGFISRPKNNKIKRWKQHVLHYSMQSEKRRVQMSQSVTTS